MDDCILHLLFFAGSGNLLFVPLRLRAFCLEIAAHAQRFGSTSWGQPRSRLNMAGDDIADIADDALKYETYEQYLDSQVR